MGCQLNQRAFAVLQAEIERRCAVDPVGQVQRPIALQRLERLRSRSGQPLNAEQLRATLDDLFPNFDERVLQRAAKANRPVNPVWGWLKVGAIATASVVGGVWVLNLPYPMIRYPVANTIPLVLLPSFMSMDHNYRGAIAATEQADQLVNQATSAADLALGATKVKTAQRHLDALPVWFLGYYPQSYCRLFRCGWRFTLDEFQQARQSVSRMEAKLFQEDNAQTQLVQAEQALNAAKQAYQTATETTPKQAALEDWQQGLDVLEVIPRQTLAGRTAQTKLMAYKRDFQDIAGFTADNLRTGNIIQAARLAAATAQKFSPQTPQTATEWEEAEKLWKEAIRPLERIKEEDSDYSSAKKLLEEYKEAQTNVSIRLKHEQKSVRAFEQAQTLTQNLLESIPDNAKSLQPREVAKLQEIINELKKVHKGTTVYDEAQQLLRSAESKLK